MQNVDTVYVRLEYAGYGQTNPVWFKQCWAMQHAIMTLIRYVRYMPTDDDRTDTRYADYSGAGDALKASKVGAKSKGGYFRGVCG